MIVQIGKYDSIGLLGHYKVWHTIAFEKRWIVQHPPRSEGHDAVRRSLDPRLPCFVLVISWQDIGIRQRLHNIQGREIAVAFVYYGVRLVNGRMVGQSVEIRPTTDFRQ